MNAKQHLRRANQILAHLSNSIYDRRGDNDDLNTSDARAVALLERASAHLLKCEIELDIVAARLTKEGSRLFASDAGTRLSKELREIQERLESGALKIT